MYRDPSVLVTSNALDIFSRDMIVWNIIWLYICTLHNAHGKTKSVYKLWIIGYPALLIPSIRTDIKSVASKISRKSYICQIFVYIFSLISNQYQAKYPAYQISSQISRRSYIVRYLFRYSVNSPISNSVSGLCWISAWLDITNLSLLPNYFGFHRWIFLLLQSWNHALCC